MPPGRTASGADVVWREWPALILDAVTILMLVAMLGTTLLGVLDRFVLEVGIAWTEELGRFLLVWTSLLAAVIATRENRHFRLEVLVPRLGRFGRIFASLVGLAAMAVVAWYGFRLARMFHFQTSPGLGLSMAWIYASVVVAALLIALYLVRDLIRALRPPEPGP